MGAVVKVERVTFAYAGQKPVLDNLTAIFPPGQISVILGRNGSGKTTLLKCLCGALRPQAGTITLAGEDIGIMGQRQIAQKVAIVRQDAQYVFPYTVLDIVMMGRTPHLNFFNIPYEQDVKIVRQNLAFVGMHTYEYKKAGELSSGESQLVLLARALAQCTPILLLDEPNAHLDIYNEMRMLQLISQLVTQQRLTVIAALHNPEIAYWFADQIFMMEQGQLHCSGSPQEVMTDANLSRIYGTAIGTFRLSLNYMAMVPQEFLKDKSLLNR